MKTILVALFLIALALPTHAEEAPFLTDGSGTAMTQFQENDSVYLEGFCPPASGSGGIRIYIAVDRTWASEDEMFDVSGNIEVLPNPADGNISRALIWKNAFPGAYDVVVDTNNDRVLQEYEKKCVVGVGGAGFLVGNPTPPAPAPTPPPPAPAPAPVPTPTPAASPATAEKPQAFSLGDYVKVKNFANVRKSPGGTLLGTQSEGATGVINGGPAEATVSGARYWFWNVDFDADPDGWVADKTLESAPAPIEESPKVSEEAAAGNGASDGLKTTAEATPPEETAVAGEIAQISNSGGASWIQSILNAVVIGISILLGLIIGSFVIAKALKRNP